MKMGRKSWVWLAAALALALLAFLVWGPDPVRVETALVQRRDLAVTVEEQGRTRARNPFVVAAPVAGRLLRIELEEGDEVEEGQRVARIALAPEDPRTRAVYRADLDAAEARQAAATAALAEAEDNAALARREQERREELFKTNLISAEERESYRQASATAEARLRSAQADLRAARAGVESARSRLLGEEDGEVTVEEVRAPVSGTVFRVLEESERVVQAGVPLLELSGGELELVVDLLTQDAVQVESGDPILVSGWGGEQVLRGEVSHVEPQAFTKISALGVEEQRVNVIGTLAEPPPALGAQYRIEAAIVTWEGSGVLTVPASAIFQRDGTWRAFAVNAAGEAELRELELGRRNREHAQVLDGLAEGEQVILFPSDLIAEGLPVIPSG